MKTSSIAVGLLALVASSCAGAGLDGSAEPESDDSPQPLTGSRMDAVLEAGYVRCGVRDDVPGFASIDSEGARVGFDKDFCRAVAAGVLGDAEDVVFVDLETADRFTALQAGEVDVLIRNTTHTAGRVGNEASTFVQPTYYDGQGMMVKTSSGFTSISEMDGVIVCVPQGTTTEGNAAAEAAERGLDWEIRSFRNIDWLQEAFLADQCDGWSADTTQFSALNALYPDDLTVLPEVFSKEPLGPVVADGDSEWARAVETVVFITLQAEEYGLTSEDLNDTDSITDPEMRRFLGLRDDDDASTGEFGATGLPEDAAFQVVSQLGNYSEIFGRNWDDLNVDRGLNELWSNGGLMYSPPFVL
ncbi:MAG: transporter substrate-binding domain-containing protein [Actinomycetota bacterium]